jgi:hypothetical protein
MNFYNPHPLMITSGEFWRCKHGKTGITGDLEVIGCVDCGYELAEQNKILIAALESAEWKIDKHGGRTCRFCKSTVEHSEYCVIGNALKQVRGS